MNGKSMTDTMSDLYKNKQSTATTAAASKKPPQTSTSSSSSSEKTNFAIDTKGDKKLLGCVSDFVRGLFQDVT